MSLVPYLHLEVPLAGAQVGDRLALDATTSHHLGRVLRLRDGAEVVLSDGAGHEAAARLAGGEVELTGPVTLAPRPAPTLTVAQGLPKGRKLDEVVRQVTELGADRIVPVAADRSVTRLAGDKADRAVARWSAVARAAAEQARRPWVPHVTAVTDVVALTDALPAGCRLFVAHVGAQQALPDAVAADRAAGTAAGAVARPRAHHLAVAVGPEGGWRDDEVAALVDAGAEVVGLGRSVLRTEHAAAAAVAVLGALVGRWS